jgi:hypothetical protein
MKIGSINGGLTKRKKNWLLTWFNIKDPRGIDATIDIGIAGKMLKTSHSSVLLVNYKRVPRLLTLLVILHELSFDVTGSKTLKQFHDFLLLRPAVLVLSLGLVFVSFVGEHVQFHVKGGFL